jgi:hypothetical protein
MKFLISFILSAYCLSAQANALNFSCFDSSGSEAVSLELTNPKDVRTDNAILKVNGVETEMWKIASISGDLGILGLSASPKGSNLEFSFRNLGSKICLKTGRVQDKRPAYVYVKNSGNIVETMICRCESIK